jgi:hypothetical protein
VFLELPNMRRIHAFKVKGEKLLDAAPCSEPWNRVTSLTLDNSAVNRREMLELLRGPEALESFSFTWKHIKYVNVFSNAWAFGDGLRHQKHSLRKLELIDRCGLMIDGEAEDYVEHEGPDPNTKSRD